MNLRLLILVSSGRLGGQFFDVTLVQRYHSLDLTAVFAPYVHGMLININLVRDHLVLRVLQLTRVARSSGLIVRSRRIPRCLVGLILACLSASLDLLSFSLQLDSCIPT